MHPGETDFEVDLEKGMKVGLQDASKDSIYAIKSQLKELLTRICNVFVDGRNKAELGVNLRIDAPDSKGLPVEQVKLDAEKTIDRTVAEKKVAGKNHKKLSNKKSPKPPRPPRGPSLDAADQKLIKELTELAMLKRARIERVKALEKMKTAKGSSSNTNVFAMVFTILFCLVFIFQGMSSRVASVNVQGSPVSAETTENALIAVQYLGVPSAGEPNAQGSGSPSSVKPNAGVDHPESLRRAAG